MASTQDSQPFHWHYADLDDHDFQIRGRTLLFIVILFAIVLLFTLVFFYARWLCSFNRETLSQTTSHPPPPPPPPPPQPRGLDPATINALPITMVTRGRAALGSECCICLGVFEDGEKVKVLPSCHHSYHSDCVDRWLTAESSCPLCRASLQVESDQLHQIPVIVTQ